MAEHSTSPHVAPAAFPEALPELTVAQEGFGAPAPRLVVLNDALANDLGLDPKWLRSDDGIAFLTGHGSKQQSAKPVATAYAGHQFGNFAGLLGDGRALLIGTIAAKAGLTGLTPSTQATSTQATSIQATYTQTYELQAKGTGPTPFSRGGDGKATLTSALREYLISEAMFAQNIPTTRALAVIATGEDIYRGAQVPFADESPTSEIQPGGIVVRVATSHLRVGTFELVARSAPNTTAPNTTTLMSRLIEFTASRHDYPNSAEGILKSVVKRQSELVAAWLAAGFVHGVMNTDNTTISGETIDYGPCAFLDEHNPRAVFSSIDRAGRYAFGAQPSIMGWNLARLAETLLPTLADATSADAALEQAQEIVGTFGELFGDALNRRWLPKIGIPAALADDPRATDLLHQWQELLATFGLDHTNAHRALVSSTESLVAVSTSRNEDQRPGASADWLRQWEAVRSELGITDSDAAALMEAANPRYIPRNHLVTSALAEAADGDFGAFFKLLAAVTDPFDCGGRASEFPAEFTQPAPDSLGSFQSYCGT